MRKIIKTLIVILIAMYDKAIRKSGKGAIYWLWLVVLVDGPLPTTIDEVIAYERSKLGDLHNVHLAFMYASRDNVKSTIARFRNGKVIAAYRVWPLIVQAFQASEEMLQ